MLKNLSIRQKAISVILLITITSLVIASTLFYTYILDNLKKSMVEKTSLIAELTGKNNQAALFFRDPQSANDNLSAFSNIEEVNFAAIYDSEGNLFADYTRESKKKPEKLEIKKNYYEFTNDRLKLVTKISVEQDCFFVYIISNLDHFKNQKRRFFWIGTFILFGVLIYAFFTTIILEKPITYPIRRMAVLMGEVAKHKDYSVRMEEIKGKHEMALLAKGFNHMLRQTETQNANIMQSIAAITEQNNQIEKQSIKIQNQRKELLATNDILVNQNKEITDSIVYAQRIQKSILAPKKCIAKLFPENFVLFRPKDIVSGDFYWFNQANYLKFFAAADCTGHGVPGTLLSILGASMLNQIVVESGISKPSEILNHLDSGFLKTFHSGNGENDSRDGMDIAFCTYDEDNQILHFAGAVNPLYYVRDNKMHIIKGDRKSVVSQMTHIKGFTNHTIEVKKGDIFYLFSDGYADQIGGLKNKKIMSKKFQEKLLEISAWPMQEQQKHLEDFFDNWKKGTFQIDDVVVIGIKI